MKLIEKVRLIIDAIRTKGLKQTMKIVVSLPFCFVFFTLLPRMRSFFLRKGLVKSNKYDSLKQFKNKHLGERCFVVCTGPSLTTDDLEKLQNDTCISMNSIIGMYDTTPWRAEHIVFSDSRAYAPQNDNVEKYLKSGDINNLFVPRYYRLPFPMNPLKCRIPKSDSVHYIPLVPATILRWTHLRFSEDISIEVVGHATVTYVALQIAAYMGFKEIYLLGCDFDITGSKLHATGAEYTRSTKRALSMMHIAREDYQMAKKYADERGIKIYNATRGGKLEVFERIDFDSLF